jgi:hypothetical protein
MTRTCALPGCDEQLRRHPGETPSKFAARRCCCPGHSYKLRGLSLADNPNNGRKGADNVNFGGMKRSEARRYLARIPARLIPQFEELPMPEKLKALEGWRA